jgi:serine/threonine-protein kinase HipA
MRHDELHFGYPPAQAAAEIVRVIEVVDGWRKHFAACGVTDADLESLAERIDGNPLLSQRRAFNPADHTTPTRPPRRRSPFAR